MRSPATPDSEYAVTVAEQTLQGKVESTGDWNKFVTRTLGTVTLVESRPLHAFRQADRHAARRGDESRIGDVEAGEAVAIWECTIMLSKESLECYRRMTVSERLHLVEEMIHAETPYLLRGTPEQVDRRFELLRRQNDERNFLMLSAIARTRERHERHCFLVA